MIDPKRIDRRVILERVIIAGFVAVLIGAMVAAKVAWGQGLDTAPSHPVDWLSAAVGGGSIGTLGMLVIGLIAVAKRFGIGMPRIVIGGADKAPKPDDESTAPLRPTAIHPDVEARLRLLEKGDSSQDKRIALIEAGVIRTEATIKEIRDDVRELVVHGLGGRK